MGSLPSSQLPSDSKLSFPLLLVSHQLPQHHIQYAMHSRTSLLFHVLADTNSHKPKNSSVLLLQPQEEVLVQLPLLPPQKRTRRRKKRPSIWEDSSVMMMMVTEQNHDPT